MKYFILPVTYAICLHYMLEAAKMRSLKQLSTDDCYTLWVAIGAMAVTVLVGQVIAFFWPKIQAMVEDLTREEIARREGEDKP